MPTLQDNSTVSANWMEHQILDHVKQALRVTLDWKAPAVSLPRKLSSVQFTLRSFQRHLERLMAFEERDGYMRVVAETKPNLQPRIDLLADDHDRFRQRVRDILPVVEDLSEWHEAEFCDVCGEIQSLLDDVDRHDLEEVRLLQDSLLSDEGGEG